MYNHQEESNKSTLKPSYSTCTLKMFNKAHVRVNDI